MMDSLKQTLAKNFLSGKQRTYTEVVEFLDKHWAPIYNEQTIERMKSLDKSLGFLSQKVPTILVAGSNGKSITAYFTAQLLRTEGLKVGTFYAPHILTYNERIAINNETIANKNFNEIANEVINAADTLSLKASSQELLVMTALSYFAQQQVDVAIMEVDQGGQFNPVTICNPKVVTITRVTPVDTTVNAEKLDAYIRDIAAIVKKDAHVIAGDQIKAHLSLMEELTEAAGGHWAMPIRKLAALGYPFEQIHGRCAALAERAAQIFVENSSRNATVVADSLLTKPKGQRGRPTLEEKRRIELNPKKTIEQFWKETVNELPSRFQVLDKEKPTILLDNARNLDAFKNLLLGIRLLHYQRPLKGLAIIIGANQNALHNEEFLKLIRYFFKKTTGQLFICPLVNPLPGSGETASWDVDQVTNDLKGMKVKARACKSFDEAFDAAKKSIDERNGLLVITGSQTIINNYWQAKGIKKF